MDSLIDLSESSKALDLSRIRFQLIRLEDTITFHLIERVQFPLNPNIYTPGAIHSITPASSYPNDVNVNDKIKKFYIEKFLPKTGQAIGDAINEQGGREEGAGGGYKLKAQTYRYRPFRWGPDGVGSQSKNQRGTLVVDYCIEDFGHPSDKRG
ncbi:hypothetical protein CHGG_04508 [Chaetomium globosum CBS 148.51]|uniref:chorismate mutase n=1 Tax=Chaetomium globosum (strain ATCC 6205 / CBS 148.51 / DSM 1962 / NBRC 6347 / NRRL 1970) TaxID=306901 RepID=Q2H138_CHAGB|nr:uncharacterized protein CHGG_04508 [Chaetomium globosum CBS 148.51]EAQ87889.1 hypothetical protein CHGG_04508 [Chaetomium globosum CBS 148.51]